MPWVFSLEEKENEGDLYINYLSYSSCLVRKESPEYFQS